MGSRLTVSHLTSEVEALGTALNALSQRLLSGHAELSSQKFALDQHAIVSISDLNGNITYANQRFCDISGYEVTSCWGKTIGLSNPMSTMQHCLKIYGRPFLRGGSGMVK
jgi:two-component system sensor histidine kinase/response regulator